MMRKTALFCALLPALAGAARPCLATPQYDVPVAQQTVPPASEDDPVGEARCTRYADFTIREEGTNSPAPAKAQLLAGGNVACGASGKRLDTEAYSYAGRRGPYLVFFETDPNGATGFKVLDADTGKVIFADAALGDDIDTLEVQDGVLRLSYLRGFNGSCSLAKDAAACWKLFATEAKLPPALAAQKPPSCTAHYAADKTPKDDPSILSYNVALTVDRTGKVTLAKLGPAACWPMP